MFNGDLGVGAVEGDAGGSGVVVVWAVDGGAVGGEGVERGIFEGGENVGGDFKELVLGGDGGAIGAECSEHDDGVYGGSVLTEQVEGVVSPCLGRPDILDPGGFGELGDVGSGFGQPLGGGGLQGQLPRFTIAGLDRHVHETLSG